MIAKIINELRRNIRFADFEIQLSTISIRLVDLEFNIYESTNPEYRKMNFFKFGLEQVTGIAKNRYLVRRLIEIKDTEYPSRPITVDEIKTHKERLNLLIEPLFMKLDQPISAGEPSMKQIIGNEIKKNMHQFNKIGLSEVDIPTLWTIQAD